MSLSNRIVERINAVKTNQSALARATKSSRSTVSDWVSGKTQEIKGERLILAAKHLQCSADWLATGKGSPTNHLKGDDLGVPVFSATQIGAKDYNKPIRHITRTGGGENVIAFRVTGDSMSAPAGIAPTFPEGIYIYIDFDVEPKSGDYILATIDGRPDALFRQLTHDGAQPYLKPLNAAHPPIFSGFDVVGTVISASVFFDVT